MRAPYRLVSLWEMLTFKAGPFVRATALLSQLRTVLGTSIQKGDEAFGIMTHEWEDHKSLLAQLRDQCEAMGLHLTKVSIDSLLEFLIGEEAHGVQTVHSRQIYYIEPYKRASAQRIMQEVNNRLRDELSIQLLIQLNPNEALLYEVAEPPFGAEVAAKFPSIAYEVEEASKCLGLERSTAAAFHAIRSLEAGVAALSRCLQIPDPTKGSDRNWGSLLRKIKDKVDAQWPASTRLAGDGRFFEEAYGALSGMQNPYRNATMHLDQKYTPEEARHVIELVRGFMKKIASRMDENGDPKA